MYEAPLPEVYCHMCMRDVCVIKGLVNYGCTRCGQQFTQRAIDAAREEANPDQLPTPESAAA
jgi:predicted RNA-binding Zn-ribbon protein involved in translation (DUF1610 family)